jgi:exodeoxyribonuclease VIII
MMRFRSALGVLPSRCAAGTPAAWTSAPGKAEQSVYWTDPVTGILCRCRPDFWREDDIIVDVKTTEDASPEEFSRSLAKWRYHVQAPFYMDGIELATGRRPKGFVFLVVEKKPPYAVAAYTLDPESIELGRAEYRADLERLAECQRTDQWPGFGGTIQKIGVPHWYLMRNAATLGA